MEKEEEKEKERKIEWTCKVNETGRRAYLDPVEEKGAKERTKEGMGGDGKTRWEDSKFVQNKIRKPIN